MPTPLDAKRSSKASRLSLLHTLGKQRRQRELSARPHWPRACLASPRSVPLPRSPYSHPHQLRSTRFPRPKRVQEPSPSDPPRATAAGRARAQCPLRLPRTTCGCASRRSST
eukprot:1550780-Prymnesium_polylepis.1